MTYRKKRASIKLFSLKIYKKIRILLLFPEDTFTFETVFESESVHGKKKKTTEIKKVQKHPVRCRHEIFHVKKKK